MVNRTKGMRKKDVVEEPRGIEKILRQPIRYVIVLGTASAASSILSVEILGRVLMQGGADLEWYYYLLYALLGLLTPLLSMVVVALITIQTIRRMPVAVGLANVVASYAVVLVVFAAMYYSCCFWGDFNDASSSYIFYQIQAEHWLPKGIVPEHTSDLRSFRGIEPRLWSRIDDRINWLHDNAYDEPSTADLLKCVKQKQMEEVIRFQPQNRVEVLGECLHFSIVTQATVGYGDIVPTQPTSKALADGQALCGLVLWGLSLGMAISNWSNTSNSKGGKIE